MHIPSLGESLNSEQVSFLKAFSKSCRNTIIEMLKNSQSGHPGGSLSSIDYLSLIYTFIVSQGGEDVVVSHGHISPAVYAVLAEMGYIPKEEVIANFRKLGSKYEGHITRHVPGVLFGTGPLGVGVSVGASFALAKKLKHSEKKVLTMMGDGEADEGQVYEMMNFAAKYNLNNLILFVDYNKVQLTASLDEVMPLNIKGHFEAAGWNVLEVDGHDFEKMWETIKLAYKEKKRPTMILGHTIMGKGVSIMEKDGKELKSTWHGKTASKEVSDQILEEIKLSDDEKKEIESFNIYIKWKPNEPEFVGKLDRMSMDLGTPFVYKSDELVDSRTAYGKALLDLAGRNKQILALSADLRGSVMTGLLAEKYPERHIECGICEQNMVSVAGGLSLEGYVPFCSTFGAFMTSRAKDQARVNDINRTNVKMVATHCGLSVGEDGPTHQAIDDMSSFLGFFNTMIIEPADPNQTDRIIRYIACHYGNFYVRMGRHKYPILTKEDGSPFFDKDYIYTYGKTDIIRRGKDITIAATGATLAEAIKAWENLKKEGVEAELVAISSIKDFDQTILDSVRKTRKLITVEDHNVSSGLATRLLKYLVVEGVALQKYNCLGVKEYQFSGTAPELYSLAGISSSDIEEECLSLID